MSLSVSENKLAEATCRLEKAEHFSADSKISNRLLHRPLHARLIQLLLQPVGELRRAVARNPALAKSPADC
jgi:hypothetical protein